jgi:hypothetical protein
MKYQIVEEDGIVVLKAVCEDREEARILAGKIMATSSDESGGNWTENVAPGEEDQEYAEPDADMDECPLCGEVVTLQDGKCPACGVTVMDPATNQLIEKVAEIKSKDAGQRKYGNVAFADQVNHKYPIDTEEHIRAAWNYINKKKNAAKYSSGELSQIKRRIIAAWKRKIDPAGPPKAEGKSMNLAYAKSLGIAVDELELKSLLAVKRVGVDKIFHYPYIWGNSKNTDLTSEYFTRETNFWDAQMQGVKRALTWDHNMDPELKADPIIGTTLEWGDDEIGRWAVSQLDRNHKYRKALDALIERQAVGTSSDSVPQYVERVQTGKSYWLKTWPWVASAITPEPCEPRMLGSVDYFKSLGITLPSPVASADQVREMVAKAHKILLDISLIGV